MSAPASRVFRVVVTQEVLVVVDPDAELVTVTDHVLRATGAESTSAADFAAIVRGAIQAEDCGPLVWITAGASTVGDVVELVEAAE